MSEDNKEEVKQVDKFHITLTYTLDSESGKRMFESMKEQIPDMEIDPKETNINLEIGNLPYTAASAIMSTLQNGGEDYESIFIDPGFVGLSCVKMTLEEIEEFNAAK